MKQQVEDRSKFALLATVSLISSLIMLDSNIVAVSLPAVARALQASFSEIEWMISAYLLTFAALLMPAGAYADLVGRRRAMVMGLIVFGLASALCGLAPSTALLNAARALQGVGGALLLTAALAIITHEFEGKERAKAFAFWGASLGIALASGPLIGGLITEALGWRWIFLINLPLCAGLVIATTLVVGESKDPNAHGIDCPGVATFVPGLFLLVWALISGNDQGWAAPAVLFKFAGSAVCLAAFVWVESRSPRPMIDLGLFERRTFVGAIAAMLGYGAAAQVLVFYLPLYLQTAYRFSPIVAGLAMMPFALPMVVVPRLTPRYLGNFSGRVLLSAGLAIVALGNLAVSLVAGLSLSYAAFVAAMIVAGSGAGILNGETVKVMSASVPADRAGMASGLASTTRFIGVLVSVATLGGILNAVIHTDLMAAPSVGGLDADALKSVIRRLLSGDIQAMLEAVAPSARDQLLRDTSQAFADGFGGASLFAAATAAVACLTTYALVSAGDTDPTGDALPRVPCKPVDCRHPI